MTRHLFLLGAQDPEMREIDRLVRHYGHDTAFAAVGADRCHAGNAYGGTAVLQQVRPGHFRPKLLLPETPVVFVECSVARLTPVFHVDHHNPGDPGFAMGPDRYLEGASLGQVMHWLGHDASETQRLLCAADHCLSAAYQGACPGVDPGELLYLRASWQGLMRQKTTGDMITGILAAALRVKARYRPQEGCSRFDDPTGIPAELPEGAAYAGLAVRYRAYSPAGDLKEMLKGGTPAQISAFMAEHETAGRRTYGNPYRGYAGAYLHQRA